MKIARTVGKKGARNVAHILTLETTVFVSTVGMKKILEKLSIELWMRWMRWGIDE